METLAHVPKRTLKQSRSELKPMKLTKQQIQLHEIIGLEKGLEKGREEGLEQGREEGAEQMQLAAATTMLQDGMSWDAIQKYTKISEEALRILAKSLVR